MCTCRYSKCAHTVSSQAFRPFLVNYLRRFFIKRLNLYFHLNLPPEGSESVCSVCVIVFGVYLYLSQQLAGRTAGGGGSAVRTWLKWFPFPVPSGLLPGEVLQVCPARRRSRGRPEGITFPLWPWNTSASSLWTQIGELDEGRASVLTRAGQAWIRTALWSKL